MKKKFMRIDLRGISQGGKVMECRNLILRQGAGGAWLGVAPRPVYVADGEFKPLATRYNREGMAMTLWMRKTAGGDDGLWSSIGTDSMEFTLVKMGVNAQCAIATADGFIVMTDSGPLTLIEQEDDGTLALLDGLGTIPEGITLEGISVGELAASTPEQTMSGVDFSRGVSQLRRSDMKVLSESLAEAYNTLAATASAGGMWLQPVVARWHLITKNGNRVYSSEPIVVAPEGWQCMGKYTVECERSDTTLTIPPINVTAKAFRLQVNISEESARQMVGADIASVEVECTPQMHILDSDGLASVKMMDSSGGTTKLTVMLPGAADRFSSRESVYARELEQVASVADDLMRMVAVLHYPIKTGNTIMAPTIGEGVEEQQKMIAQAISRSGKNGLSAEESLLYSISRPHSFTARRATVSGRTVVWGDITPLLSTRMNVKQLFCDWIDGACEGFLKVSRRDGGIYSKEFRFDRTPQRWAPSVMIADIEAVGISVYYRVIGGGVYHGELPLHRMPDGRHSGMLSTTLIGNRFNHIGEVMPKMPKTMVEQIRRAGVIAVGDIENPLEVVAAAECCHSPVEALLPAVKSQSTWDFSRCHIYALSRSGVYAVNLNIARREITSSLIDARGVEDEGKATRIDDGVVMIYGNRLLRLSASHAEDVGAEYDFRQVAHDSTSQQLWGVSSEGELRVVDSSLRSVSKVTTPFDVEYLYTSNNRLWLSDTDALYRLSTDEELGQMKIMIPIKWRRNVELPRDGCLRFVEVRISGSNLSAMLIVRERAEATDGRGKELMRVPIEGAIKSPIKRRISASCVPWIEVEIEGEVSADFRIEEVIMHIV